MIIAEKSPQALTLFVLPRAVFPFVILSRLSSIFVILSRLISIFVILSGARTSRSEVLAESKDPYTLLRFHVRLEAFSTGSPQ
jgi:hypothetical protein